MRWLIFLFGLLLASCGSAPKQNALQEQYDSQYRHAAVLMDKGDLDAALKVWLKALDTARLLDDTGRQGDVRLAIAQVSWLQGRESDALEQATLVARLDYFGADKAGMAWALQGQIYLRGQKLSSAEQSFKEAEKLCTKCQWQSYLYNLQSSLYLQQGLLDRAEAFAEKADAGAEGQGAEAAQAQRNLAAIQFERGNVERAKAHIGLALDLDRKAAHPEGVAATYRLWLRYVSSSQPDASLASSRLAELCAALPVWVKDCQHLNQVTKSR